MKFKHVLATLKMSDPIALFKIAQDWQSAVRTHFLFAAGRSGLLKALQTPRTKAELTELLDVQRPEILDALLDVGLSVRELGQKAGRYRLRGRRARAMAKPQGDPLAAVLEANVTYYNRIYRHTPQRLHGGPDEDCLTEIGDVVARFSALAEPMIRGAISEVIPGPMPFRMLDVGCGSGIYLNTVALMNPRATGVGLEVDPQVAANARQNLRRWGIDDRFDIVCGDIQTDAAAVQLEGTFQLITMLNVVYYFAEDARPGVFQSIRKLLGTDGKLLIINSMQSAGKDFGAANLNLAVSSMAGCTPLPDRHRLVDQLSVCGFERTTQKRLASQNAFFSIVAQ
jgi:SAM-dependent methyltransferase